MGVDDTPNTWDNGAEGNYWAGARTRDLNGDGISDTPLVINEYNRDNYPLMEPWSPIRIFAVSWDEVTYRVTISSNSTIASFNFSQPLKQISFNVTGPSATLGFCKVTIPKTLLRDNPWKVLLNTTDITAQTTITENETHTSLHFTYTHSTYKVQILGTWVVPEFPTAIIPVLFVIITLCAVILKKKIKTLSHRGFSANSPCKES